MLTYSHPRELNKIKQNVLGPQYSSDHRFPTLTNQTEKRKHLAAGRCKGVELDQGFCRLKNRISSDLIINCESLQIHAVITIFQNDRK